MDQAAKVDLAAYRGAPFIDRTVFENFDYSDATFVMQIRKYRDAPDVVLTLGNAVSTAQGISATYHTDTDPPASWVQIRINETTLEALSYTAPRGGDLRLQYALDVTGGGHEKLRRMEGAFILRASANG